MVTIKVGEVGTLIMGTQIEVNMQCTDNSNGSIRFEKRDQNYSYAVTMSHAEFLKDSSFTPHNFIGSLSRAWLNSLEPHNKSQRFDYPKVSHSEHEVVNNSVLGKAFKYCRTCKIEV